ncbi:MAG: response regulator [Deltaproteobacteria bacterium]|nr:response regulator [Deltaproteobacteria bacterium]
MPRTILLVDDSLSIRSILKVYLLPLKLELLDAEDGLRACQLLRLVPVDLIIADVKMEPMDGLTLLEKVRTSERDEIRRVPVILLTGETGEGLRERGLQAGANAFIHKPIDPKHLLDCVQGLLSGSDTNPKPIPE